MQFSLCVPVYNAEKYLSQCIDSVLNQSYTNFELILVDDGSTDSSYDLCKIYQLKDCRIKAFTKKNGGQISAREHAFKHVTGDVVLCLDADDFIENTSLEILNDYFKKYKCDCIYFNYQLFSNDKITKVNRDIKKLECIKEKKELYRKICLNSCFNSVCRKAFKKEFIPCEKMDDFYKIRRGEDLIQTLFIHKKMSNVLFVPDVLYNYRVNTESISHNKILEKKDVEDFVRYYLYLFLKRENYFSKKDWDDYGTYCSEKLFSNLLNISVAKVNLKKKKEYFNIIRNSAYYKEFLYKKRTDDLKKNVFINLFEKQHDVLIILLLYWLSNVRKSFNLLCLKLQKNNKYE